LRIEITQDIAEKAIIEKYGKSMENSLGLNVRSFTIDELNYFQNYELRDVYFYDSIGTISYKANGQFLINIYVTSSFKEVENYMRINKI
jgi:hypothetical protein